MGDAGADVFRADVAFEFGMLHEFGGLFAGATEEEMAAGGVEAVGEFADGAEASGVDGGHVAKTEDDDGREGTDVVGDFLELVGGAEEKWSVNAIDDGVVGDVLALEDVDGAVSNVIAGDAGDGSGA